LRAKGRIIDCHVNFFNPAQLDPSFSAGIIDAILRSTTGGTLA